LPRKEPKTGLTLERPGLCPCLGADVGGPGDRCECPSAPERPSQAARVPVRLHVANLLVLPGARAESLAVWSGAQPESANASLRLHGQSRNCGKKCETLSCDDTQRRLLGPLYQLTDMPSSWGLDWMAEAGSQTCSQLEFGITHAGRHLMWTVCRPVRKAGP
jgi:hypothetical protein